MAAKEINVTRLFTWLLKSEKRFNLLVGGSGSGKSWAAAQVIINRMLDKRRRGLVTRKTTPSLRLSCWKLIRQLIAEYEIPCETNKSEMTLTFANGSELVFKGLDDAHKLKSADFDIIWIEEATELLLDDFKQLNLRLRGDEELKQIIATFNPISWNHWLKTEIVDKGGNDLAVNSSTHKDNPFIDKEYVAQLESLAEQDQNYYKIYALGQWGVLTNVIYTNWQVVDEIPGPGEIIYGLDFGYNNPTALGEYTIRDEGVYERQLIYQSKLTNADLKSQMFELNLGRREIFADSSEPARIEELNAAGFNVLPASKDVKAGIDYCKAQKLFILSNSPDIIKETRGYSWKLDRDGRPFDEPVKFLDHTQDCRRYALFSRFVKYGAPEMRDRMSLKRASFGAERTRLEW